MDVLKRRIYAYIFGIYIYFVIALIGTTYMVIILQQPNRSVCVDCSSGMNDMDDLERNIKIPSLIPPTDKELQKRLAATSKYPFSNCTSFYLEPPFLCSKTNEWLLVVLIHSSPYHFERRKAIRKTWANSNYYAGRLVRLFLFGTVNNTLLQTYIKKEHRYYGDILQGTFLDSYYNLTFNTMMGLQWVQKSCSNAQVVVKVDDDIIIDMFTFFRKYVLSFASKSNHVLCSYAKRMIMRGKSNKWYVDENQLKGEKYYPPYCEGKLVVMTKDVVSKLYNFAFETNYFFIEDVYFYGFVMNKISLLKIVPLRWEIDFQLNDDIARYCLLKKKENCSYFAAGVSSEQKLYELWSLYSQRSDLRLQ